MEEKFSLSWSNLSAWYTETQDGKKTKKMILNEVSGTVFSGSLVAIMGVSGVGKTTFLASLAGRNKERRGLLLFNNYVLEQNYLNAISNYVYQKDVMVESLTVMEHMIFMSSFKLNKSSREATLIIEDILIDLNLEKCKDVLLKHLSGGERKRVSLGVELLNDPLILFCDEPTTGLDSSNAIIITQKLRNRITRGKLVMLTIHQPSSQLFQYFTHIILIANGQIFYNGCRAAIADYFDSLNLRCPINFNPAEFYIKCISNGITNIKKRTNSYKNKLFIGDECCNRNVLLEYRYNKTNFCISIYWLIWRTYLDTKRNFGYHAFQTILLLITATILASFYSTVETNGDHSVQNIKGVLYFFTSELIFTHTYNVVNTFPEEYCILLREKPLYSTHAYFLSKVLAIVPRNIVQPFLFLAINFFFVQFLSGFVMFLQIYAVTICACMCGSMLGFCISAFFTSLEYMDLFIAPFELITMLAAGLLINVHSSLFLRWVKYASPFYFTYESLSIIFWTGIEEIDCKNGSTICYDSGREVLEEIGFYTESVYVLWNMVYTVALMVVVGFITFLVIFYKRNRHCSY